jgi:hypothetical protein
MPALSLKLLSERRPLPKRDSFLACLNPFNFPRERLRRRMRVRSKDNLPPEAGREEREAEGREEGTFVRYLRIALLVNYKNGGR